MATTPERLIESMRSLLWERGYVGTSPKAVLRRADVGQGSMYHHFSGKRDLGVAAIRRTADEMRVGTEELFATHGGALERVRAYLLRERDVLRGCPVGRLTQDPEVMADDALRAPVDETFAWLRARIAEVLAEGREGGELRAAMDPEETAAAVVATLQGGYVLARAARSRAPFDQAVAGILGLLKAHGAQD
ncbi:TetR family transcriptional regulator C-terminal domain-containing protein [Streptomyces sp. NPDC050560]|uniref:TetR family transcriptional regulator C-terminal domain-containing protein n=1 Tax=Streptomyces sp. NPDC050560 TaxID=3365630 RepID=UPI00379C87B7